MSLKSGPRGLLELLKGRFGCREILLFGGHIDERLGVQASGSSLGDGLQMIYDIFPPNLHMYDVSIFLEVSAHSVCIYIYICMYVYSLSLRFLRDDTADIRRYV